MAFRYRNTSTKGEVEFTREQPDLEASPDWKQVESGDALPARAPNPGVLDALTVLSEHRDDLPETPAASGYEAGAVADVGTVENPGVDAAHPRIADVEPATEADEPDPPKTTARKTAARRRKSAK